MARQSLGGRRRRTSSIDKLSPELRSELDNLLSNGRTYEEITEHLKSMGAEVSKSAVGRYGKWQRDLTARLRMTREAAASIRNELADVEGDAGQLVIESLQATLLQAHLMQCESDEIDPEQIAEMAKAVKDLQYAFKANTETRSKIRDMALKEAAQRATKAAKSRGMNAETVEFIKSQILGVSGG